MSAVLRGKRVLPRPPAGGAVPHPVRELPPARRDRRAERVEPSRNFVSPTLNILLFNNSYHTVHHWKPGVYWSLTPKLHADVAAKIHPELLVQSWLKYVGYTYFVRPFTAAGAPPLTAA